MLVYLTKFIQRYIIMAFYSHSTNSFVHTIRSCARPFDEIIYSYDLTTASTTNTDVQCPVSIATKDTVT